MCGRFTLRTPMNVLAETFHVTVEQQLPLRFNIAPTQEIATVRARRDAQESSTTTADGTVARRLNLMRWGLIPSWAKDPAIGSRMINARSETIAEKPSFRTAFRRRRCLILADGYFEWQKLPQAKKKQPMYIRMRDEQPFAFAGLWEAWSPPGSDGDPLRTCTIITTDSNDLTRDVHDRMPVILHPDDYDLWLDPNVEDQKLLLPLLEPFESDAMKFEPVSTHVNNVRNDDPSCIAVQRELF